VEAVPLDLEAGVPVGVSPLGAAPGPLQESLSEMLALTLDFHSGARACILAGCLSPIRTQSLSVQFVESVLLLKSDGTSSSLFSYDVPFDERDRLPSTFRLPLAATVVVGSEGP
jgi:hypothetical protein